MKRRDRIVRRSVAHTIGAESCTESCTESCAGGEGDRGPAPAHARLLCRHRLVLAAFVMVAALTGFGACRLLSGSGAPPAGRPGVFAVRALTVLAVVALAAAGLAGVGRRAAAGVLRGGPAVPSSGLAVRAVRACGPHRSTGVDELTGLPDRRRFLDLAGRALAGGGHRARGTTSAALLLLDVDRMRDINQALGPELGDELLVALGQRLRAAVPTVDLIARVDGDAFAVLLRGADATRAEELAGRLRATFDAPVILAAMPVQPTVSIGIALAPQHGRTPAELLRHAEEAMHAAKRHRTGQAVYVPAASPVDRARLLLRAEVRQALDRGQIELSYQPKADLRSGRISGVEALVRWRHPVDGMRQPDVFLPEIDRAGLMPKLTAYVLDAALTDCARWRRRGVTLTVSVNVAASVIVDRAFAGEVRAALARHQLPPSVLVIELTEDSLVEAWEPARETLADLRSGGVRVSLDDYGTGYCSLTYLRELPADEVKLDRTFLRDLDRDPDAAAIVRHTVDLAHALRLRIVIEGVETLLCWQTLAGWECDEVQGFFVAGPMASDEIIGWLEEWAARPASLVPRASRAPFWSPAVDAVPAAPTRAGRAQGVAASPASGRLMSSGMARPTFPGFPMRMDARPFVPGTLTASHLATGPLVSGPLVSGPLVSGPLGTGSLTAGADDPGALAAHRPPVLGAGRWPPASAYRGAAARVSADRAAS